MSNDRERGTVLRTLDDEYLRQQALGHLKVMAPDVDWTEANPVMRLAGERTEDHALYVVCTEGVGWEVGNHDPLVVDVYVKWNVDGKPEGSMTSLEVSLSRYEVEQAMEKGEDVDLADLVRTFGDRLESNFWLWHRKFNPAPKRTRKAAKK